LRRRPRVTIRGRGLKIPLSAANFRKAAMSYTIEHKGKKATLPSFSNLPVGAIRKARNMDPDEQIWFILETVLDIKGMAVIDSMSLSEFTEAMNGWTQGAPLGESLKSSKS
jgi:hypothetical protein